MSLEPLAHRAFIHGGRVMLLLQQFCCQHPFLPSEACYFCHPLPPAGVPYWMT